MERPSLSYCSSNQPAKLDGNSHPYVVHQMNRAKMRNRDLGVTLDSPDHRVVRATESSGVFCHRVQYRLDVHWRFGDHAQDRAGPSLLLEGFSELAFEILQLLGGCFLPLQQLTELLAQLRNRLSLFNRRGFRLRTGLSRLCSLPDFFTSGCHK